MLMVFLLSRSAMVWAGVQLVLGEPFCHYFQVKRQKVSSPESHICVSHSTEGDTIVTALDLQWFCLQWFLNLL